MKPRISNIVLYVFTKYFLFYILIMFLGKNYGLIKIGSLKNPVDWIFYFYIFLSLPVAYLMTLGSPLYFTFRIKSKFYFTFTLAGIFIAEYFIYTALASPGNLSNGIFNAIIGLTLLLIFFYKSMPFSSEQVKK